MRSPYKIILARSGSGIAGTYMLPQAAKVSINIYKKSDALPHRTLLRTLDKTELKPQGLNYFYWNGLDDDDVNIIATNDYIVEICVHEITHNWYMIGNSSTVNHGVTRWSGYSRCIDALPDGDIVYWGRSWDEGGGMKLIASDKSVDINTGIPILAEYVGARTQASFEYLCQNSKWVFCSAVNPYNGDSFVYAIDKITREEVIFSSGTPYTTVGGYNYASVLNLLTSGDTNQSIECDEDYLWIAVPSTDEIIILDISGATPTGAPTAASPQTFTNPICLTYQIAHGASGARIWFMNGTTGQVIKGVIGANGALSSGALFFSGLPSDKKALAIDNTNHILSIAVGGSEQRIWNYDASPATPSGAFISKFGQAGGNSVTPDIADDRFLFTDVTTGMGGSISKPLDKCYLRYDQVTGDLYVGDVGNNRCQVFAMTFPNATGTLIHSVMSQPAVYQVSQNPNNGYEMFLGTKKFIANLDGTTTYSKNYDSFVPLICASSYRFAEMFTLEGREFATLSDNVTNGGPPNPWVDSKVYEITSTGLRDCGVNLNEVGKYFGNFITKDGIIYNLNSVSYATNATPTLRKQMPNALDGSNNPSWGSWEDVVTFEPIKANGTMVDAGSSALRCITDDGIAVMATSALASSIKYHLEGFDIVTGKRVWSTYVGTSRDEDTAGQDGYHGKEFPDGRYMERGNFVNAKTFGSVATANNLIFIGYVGENREGSQCNIITVIDSKGHVIDNFGKNRSETDYIEPRAAETGGNGENLRVWAVDADTVIMVQSNEDALGQYRIFGNISSLTYKNKAIVPPLTEVLEGNDQYDEVVFNTHLSDTANITIPDTRDASYIVTSGKTRYEREYPDIYSELETSVHTSSEKPVYIDIHPAADYAAKYYTLKGKINFREYTNIESVTTPGAEYQLLDISDKVIATIGLSQYTPNNRVRLTISGVTMLDTLDGNTIGNIITSSKEFYIKVTELGVSAVYNDGSEIFAPFSDLTCEWNKPARICQVVRSSGSVIGWSRIGTSEVRHVESLVNQSAPVLIYVEAINSTHIELTFNQLITGSLTGLVGTKNGSPHTYSVISTTLNKCLITCDAISFGDTLTIAHTSQVGSTENSNGVLLGTFDSSFISVINSVPNSTLVRGAATSKVGVGTVLDVTSDAFNCVAGDPLILITRIPTFVSISEIENLAGTKKLTNGDWILDKQLSVAYKVQVYRCQNPDANAVEQIKVSYSAFNFKPTIWIIQNSGTMGVKDSEAHGTSSGSNTVTSSALTTLQANTYAIAFYTDDYDPENWSPAAPSGFTLRISDVPDSGSIADRTYNSIQSGITITAIGTTNPNNKAIIVIAYEY